ncbi:GTP-binding protein [Methanonatronarchaeum sp. AMET-Sl]|uniref:GTP-binding protein n=1 Tax=Methanonatronarchaeum sp. AMET-Sl TaxID=3037654 RepID=UPI00244E1A59|nr:GTP-binding protein [Methanonatronarchaeum sp. AMET-Sl]WGI17508.1 GTP-binding protein [Methanonatronarchaeum sp. AMET-Sl]
MKVSFIGGFYGSGKTTLISEMAKKLEKDGKSVLIIDNEKGNSNVDPLFVRELGLDGDELTGGCICFYLNRLKEIMNKVNDKSSKDVLFVEPVSYFLPSKLYFDLRNEFGDEIDLAPITILLDGRELKNVIEKDREFPLIDARQVKDAEIVVINKIDVLSKEDITKIEEMVYNLNQDVKILHVSAKDSTNINEIIDVVLNEIHEGTEFNSPALFQEYLKSVSGISERGEKFKFKSNKPFNKKQTQQILREVVTSIDEKISNAGGEINHIKAYIGNDNSYLKGSRPRATKEVDITGNLTKITEGRLILNVIASEVPDDLIYGIMLKTLSEINNTHQITVKT